jgi:hypothetical protein
MLYSRDARDPKAPPAPVFRMRFTVRTTSSQLPNWARLLDAVCLLLAVVAVVIALSGGFRERVFGMRLALTSPYRLLLWAVILGVIRHVLAPQRPIYAELPSRLRAAWRTAPMRSAAGALVGTRLAILFVGYMAIFMIGYPNGKAPWRIAENEFGNLPARWDVGWYLTIAVDGYSFSDAAKENRQQQDIVFFPALPLLMRVVGRLLGGASTAYVWGGTIVSLFAFLGGLIYLYRLARDLLEDEGQAGFAVWLIASYPFALFFGAPYTESLFLLGSAGAFYHCRRGEYAKGAAWGLLVGLTRPNGCFLAVPLAVLALQPWLPGWLAGGAVPKARVGFGAAVGDALALPQRSDRTSLRTLTVAIAAASLPGIGVLLYSAFIWYLTGDPLNWAEGHVAWGRSYQGLSILVTERYQFLSQEGLYAYTSRWSNDLIQLLGALFVLVPVWPVARRLGLAYAVFILINILPPLAAGGLLSAGRFSSVLFPAFIWFAMVIHERHRTGWLTSFIAFQALNAALFFTWREMY